MVIQTKFRPQRHFVLNPENETVASVKTKIDTATKILEQEKAGKWYSCETEIFRQIRKDQQEQEKELELLRITEKYPQIDIGFLSLRNTQKLRGNINIGAPRFSVHKIMGTRVLSCIIQFGIDDSTTWSYAQRFIGIVDYELPAKMVSLLIGAFSFVPSRPRHTKAQLKVAYAEFWRGNVYKLGRITRHRIFKDNEGEELGKVSFKKDFVGLIPMSVKERIEEASPHFDEMFLVAECPEWQVHEEKAPPPDPDPLIIGMKYNKFFFVEQFNISTIEDYVKREFTL